MAIEDKSADELLAVLVIYNLEPTRSSTFNSLTRALQFENLKIDLLIYDNSLNDHDVPRSDYLAIHYIHDPTNGGVSKAYNAGCTLAKELNKKWILLFDQDDLFPEVAIRNYREAIHFHPDIKIFAPTVEDEKSIISPFLIRFGGGWRIKPIQPGVYKTSQYLLINSGLLISVKAFQEAGGYDERFPMDFSDLDFILRLRRLVQQFVILPIVYKHSLTINTSLSIESRLSRFKIY